MVTLQTLDADLPSLGNNHPPPFQLTHVPYSPNKTPHYNYLLFLTPYIYGNFDKASLSTPLNHTLSPNLLMQPHTNPSISPRSFQVNSLQQTSGSHIFHHS